MQTQKTDNIENLRTANPIYEDFWEPTPEQIKETMENHLRELQWEKNGTMLYDPTDKKMRSYAECNRRYGQELADKMLHAKEENNGRLTPEDYADLMRNHQQGKVPSKPTQKVRSKSGRTDNSTSKTATKKSPFIKLDHDILRNPKVRMILKKSMMLYLYLKCHIVREKFPGDRLNLYERYYKKGKLAASFSLRKLSQDLYLDEKTVTVYVQELAAENLIEIEKIPAAEAFDKQDHSVYVLGHHSPGKHETYLVEQLLTSDR